MEIVELPNPVPGRGEILVKTHYSAISTGTEGKTVSDARKGYIAKAQSRKAEVNKVIKAARTHGLKDTYKMVMNKLEALQPLGYSSSGEVISVGADIKNFKPGDFVACGGASASHAEVIVVPENLAVKLLPETPMDQAAFTTIGAIAMQGIRRAELNIGENCVVIGLGIIGQMTIRLLKAAGVRTFGIDIKPDLVQMALASGAEKAVVRNNETLESQVAQFSDGHGVDAVIITAATQSLDPVELAGTLCRVHGTVVIVGSVPTGFSRKQYYRKELDLRMSTSYGPGRYDANYEEKGLDYPIGQVRWTENRNMQAFADLLGRKSLVIDDLISHKFDFEKAQEAFDLVVNREEDKMGIVLKYDITKPISEPKVEKGNPTVETDKIAVIGVGSFASNFLMPTLSTELKLTGVLTSRPHTAEHAKRKYSFEKAYPNIEEAVNDSSTGAVVIATRHDSHADLAIKALTAGKRVFVEKPLALNLEEFSKVSAALSEPNSPDLMVGFNRRFAPAVEEIHSKISGVPVAIQYRINAGSLPSDHWVHDPQVGGGRIIGEACHFVDLCTYLAQSPITSVSAQGLEQKPQNGDSFAATLKFENGSIASISYFSNGHSSMSKEYLEIFGGGISAVMDDYKSLQFFGDKSSKEKMGKQDKGHASELMAFAKALKAGTPFPISVSEVLHSTLATFAIVESIRNNGELIQVSDLV